MSVVRHALVLAAGRGERMRPLTDHTPKPLLEVRGKPLIEWHLEALAAAGVREVVVNTAWLEDRFPAALGDGGRWGLRIHYSMEGRDHGGALETAGGMKKALPLLGSGRFWVVSGDVFVPDFRFGEHDGRLEAPLLARLWLTGNPAHHPAGDFGIEPGTGLATRDAPRLTWASVGLFDTRFVTGLMADLPAGTKAPLRPYLDAAIARRELGAARLPGRWTDVGTPQRLAALNAPGS